MNQLIPFNSLKFSTSVAQSNQLPPDVGQEVAFAGRSNAGKSSAINAIARQKKLAKTSNTPGRTQLINFFEFSEMKYLVDLPGYGYAKVDQQTKKKWQALLEHYLKERESLLGLILIMDIRHPLKPLDWQFIEWSAYQQSPIHILLTKSDKLKRHAANQSLQQVQKALKEYQDLVSVQLFSAVTGAGIQEAQEKILQWLE